jgi:NADH dehydrogenase FAD-containing subunit
VEVRVREPNVVVVGGGYAGALAAIRLGRRVPTARITVVDPGTGVVQKIRLHQVAAGQRVPEVPYPDLFRGNVRHRRARAVAIAQGTVALDDGAQLPWDWLVVAAGSEADRGAIAGLRQFGRCVSEREDAAALAATTGRVAVIGGGITGIELASELRAAGRAVVLVGPAVDHGDGGALERALAAMGVERVPAAAVGVEPHGVALADGKVAADVVAWAGGLRPAAWLAAAGVPVDGEGAVRVDAHLRIVGLRGAFAAGDACASHVRGRRLRMACATAMPMGCHAGDAIAAEIAGKEPPPFRFGFVVRCLSVGRRDGRIVRVDRDDVPAWSFGGRPAAWIKEAICRYTVVSLRAEARGWGYRWPRPADRLRELTGETV